MPRAATLATLAAVLVLPTACATPQLPPFEPIELMVSHDVDYKGEVVTVPVSLEPPALELRSVEPGDDVVHIQAQFVNLTAEDAAGLFGEQASAVGAWTVRREDVENFVDEYNLLGLLPGAQALYLVPGQEGTLTVANERAYVRSFEVQTEGQTILADPVVDVLTDGVLLEATGLFTETGVALDLGLTMTSVQSPIREIETRVPGCAFPVTIQQPVVSEQNLATKATVTGDEALVLSALSPESTGRVLVFVWADRARVAKFD